MSREIKFRTRYRPKRGYFKFKHLYQHASDSNLRRTQKHTFKREWISVVDFK